MENGKFSIALLLLLTISGALQGQRPSGAPLLCKGCTPAPAAPLPPQRDCGHAEYEQYLNQHFDRADSKAFEATLATASKEVATKRSDEVLTVPVVVHVVHQGEPVGSGTNISYLQVLSQLEALNEDFRRKQGTSGWNAHPDGADVRIEFAPALRDPEGNALAEPGVHRVDGGRTSWTSLDDIEQFLKPQTIWDPNQYCNIWVASFGGTISGYLGYAQFPSLSGQPGLNQNGGASSTDGIIIRSNAFGRSGNVQAPYHLGRTLTHEMGHWLGLRHIWGDGDCSVDDYCQDTPPAAQYHTGCPTWANTCTGNGPDMLENYMDFVNDECMHLFTNDQKARMRTVLKVSPQRKELLQSEVHLETERPIARFVTASRRTCAQDSLELFDASANGATHLQWAVRDQWDNLIDSFSGRSGKVWLPYEGHFHVQLVATNSHGSDTLERRNYLTAVKPQQLTLPYEEDVEKQHVLEGWAVENRDDDITWGFANLGAASSQWSLVFDNFNFSTNLVGTRDRLMSPRVVLPDTGLAYLQFEVAYAQFNEDLSDTLEIAFSTDCGKTLQTLWLKGGKDLATAPDTVLRFTPTQTQWRTEQISLHTLQGQEVHLAIVNRSGWGNRLFIDNIRISIEQPQVPTAAFTVGKDTICQGGRFVFSDQSTGFPASWEWSFPGGTPSSSTEQQPLVTYHIPGTYPARLKVKNAAGKDSVTMQQVVTVEPPPQVEASPSDSTVCAGDSVLLTASGGVENFWYNSRGALVYLGDTFLLQPQNEEELTVYGESRHGCLNATVTRLEILPTPPQPDISQHGLNLSTTASGNLQWYRNSVVLAGATGNSYTATGNGTYQVASIGGNGCRSFSEPIEVTGASVQQLPPQQLVVRPNPATEYVEFQLPQMNGIDFHLTMTDAGGKAVPVQPVQLGTNIQIPIAHLPTGAYILSIVAADQAYQAQVIKQ